MKIVFFGNPEFAAKSLGYISDFDDISVELVVTNPDKKMGRGLNKKMSAVKAAALKLSHEIFECHDLNDTKLYSTLKSIKADLFIVIAYKFIPENIYNLAKIGAINLHASLLPKYRGASPIQYAILNGEKETGLTTFYLNNKIDRGKVISQIKLPINDRITYNGLYEDLSKLSKNILRDTIDRIISSNYNSTIINNKVNSHLAPKIRKEDYRINWNDTSFNIHNKIRALSYKGAYAFYLKKKIKFYETYYYNSPTKKNVGSFEVQNRDLIINTGRGYIKSKYVQVEGSKKITATDFINSNQDIHKFE